jgi:hypothetical protein
MATLSPSLFMHIYMGDPSSDKVGLSSRNGEVVCSSSLCSAMATVHQNRFHLRHFGAFFSCCTFVLKISRIFLPIPRSSIFFFNTFLLRSSWSVSSIILLVHVSTVHSTGFVYCGEFILFGSP